MSGQRGGRFGEEDGIALVAVLLAVVILFGLSVVFVATATFESRSSSLSERGEAALHVAEAAADGLIPTISWPDETATHGTVMDDADGERQFVTTDEEGDPHQIPSDATPETERDLLLAYAAEAEIGGSGPVLTDLNEGVGFAIRPVDENDEPRDVIYTVGWVPDRDDAQRRRILKLRFDALRFRPDVGLLSGGDLTLGGNAGVEGEYGHVHVEGDAGTTPGSGNFNVSGDLTATGDVTASVCDQVDGDCRGQAAPRPIPPIGARRFYRMSSQAAETWYDLCPPGNPDSVATIREHSGTGEPCTGDLRWSNPSHSQVGWRWSQGQQEWTSTGSHAGVFYVHRSNARITGTSSSPTAVTIISEADPNDDGESSGHIHVGGGGSTDMTSALSGVAVIADRDLRLRGGTMSGLVAAHEQIHVPGNPTINGAVIAEDATDTDGSWVRRDTNGGAVSVEGTMTINYDELLDVPLLGVIRITAWNEL